jgi:hypothetical protein
MSSKTQREVGLHEQVAQLREQITDLKSQRRQFEGCKIAKVEAYRRLDDWIRSLSDRYALSADLFTSAEPGFPRLLQTTGDSRLQDAVDSTEALFALLLPEALRMVFAKQLEMAYADDGGMSGKDREAKLRAIGAQIFELEVTEERLIQRAEDIGMAINRRRDTDPKALLEA